jgi:hypothetical protein
LSYIAYLFEARGIQSYILDGGRLADQVAASNLLDALCRRPLETALRQLELVDVSQQFRNPEAGEVAFPRCGGGAFYAVFGGDSAAENAARLRDLWGIAAAAFCPGLEFVQAVAGGKTLQEAVDEGTRTLVQARNRPPASFPETPPLVQRSPRTGQPARLNDRLPDGIREWADASTLRKRYAKDGNGNRFRSGADLTNRFLVTDEEQKRYYWPRNLGKPDPDDPDAAQFPLLADNAYVAVIHADGNGLGQALMALRKAVAGRPDDYQRIFRGFSDCIEGATLAAAQAATAKVLVPAAAKTEDSQRQAKDCGNGNPIMPARPIVLGGDDLTIIVRADLALPFTVAFLEAFEKFSAERLKELRGEVPSLDERLTACAGVAFIKATQPFHLANHLAEHLCARAKSASDAARGESRGPKPSSLAFARITTSVLDETIRTVKLGEKGDGRLGARAYFLGGVGDTRPRWTDLQALAELLARPEMARGPTRQLLTLLGQDVVDAEKRYRRWQEVLEKNPDTEPRLSEFKRLLLKFGSAPEGLDLPFVQSGSELFTPLSDALALRAVGFGGNGSAGEEPHG